MINYRTPLVSVFLLLASFPIKGSGVYFMNCLEDKDKKTISRLNQIFEGHNINARIACYATSPNQSWYRGDSSKIKNKTCLTIEEDKIVSTGISMLMGYNTPLIAKVVASKKGGHHKLTNPVYDIFLNSPSENYLIESTSLNFSNAITNNTKNYKSKPDDRTLMKWTLQAPCSQKFTSELNKTVPAQMWLEQNPELFNNKFLIKN